jgi:hypothetical protein
MLNNATHVVILFLAVTIDAHGTGLFKVCSSAAMPTDREHATAAHTLPNAAHLQTGSILASMQTPCSPPGIFSQAHINM